MAVVQRVEKITWSTKSSKLPFKNINEVKNIIGTILLCSLTEKSDFNQAHLSISKQNESQVITE